MATKSGTSGPYPDNKYDGLFLGDSELRQDINMKAVPPNGDRPMETGKTTYLFGTWGD